MRGTLETCHTLPFNQKDFLVGHDHEDDEANFTHVDDVDLLVLEDGTIIGLQNAKRMLKLGMLKAATQINIIVLTPLIGKLFKLSPFSSCRDNVWWCRT